MSEDPIRFLSCDYAHTEYVNNRLTHFTDPSGLLWQEKPRRKIVEEEDPPSVLDLWRQEVQKKIEDGINNAILDSDQVFNDCWDDIGAINDAKKAIKNMAFPMAIFNPLLLPLYALASGKLDEANDAVGVRLRAIQGYIAGIPIMKKNIEATYDFVFKQLSIITGIRFTKHVSNK